MTSLDEMRRREAERSLGHRTQRRSVYFAVVPSAIGLSVCAAYITLVATVAADLPNYHPSRPSVHTMLTLMPAPILAGAGLGFASVWIIQELFGDRHRVLQIASTALLFGTLLPFVSAILMPLSRALLAAGSVAGSSDIGNRIVEVVYGTPLFALNYGVRGIGEGMVAGAAVAVISGFALVRHFSATRTISVYPAVVSVGLSIALVCIVLVGPASFFDKMVLAFAGR